MSGLMWTRTKRCRRLLAGVAPACMIALTIAGCGGSSTTTTEGTGPTERGAAGAAKQSQEAEAGAQVFASAGCGSCHTFKAAGSNGTTGPNLDSYLEPDDDKPGIEEMIVDPNAEVAEGYQANVMPKNFGESLSSEEVKQLVAFLYENSPASEGSTGEQGENEKKGK